MEARFVDDATVSATPAVEAIRRFKTPEEIESVKQAAALADAGYKHFVETAEAGMAEYELVAEVEAFLKTNGAEDNFMLIGSGGTEVFGMRPPTDRRFQKGDNITTELTPQVNGYYAQICRTLVLGEPSARPATIVRDLSGSAGGRARISSSPASTSTMSRACKTMFSAEKATANTRERNTRASADTILGFIRTRIRGFWKMSIAWSKKEWW